jgi:hypothetical protein
VDEIGVQIDSSTTTSAHVVIDEPGY